jgi:cobalt-precorrin 5A hydrolase
MDFRKAMARLIAIGIGCRKNCPGETIVALVQRALADLGEIEGERRLFSLIDKQVEAGLHTAAAALACDLVFLPRAALAAMTPRLLTRSAATQKRFGLESIAEASALAGAGEKARLLGPRLVENGATCAIAMEPSSSLA